MDTYQQRSDDLSAEPPIQCEACRTALFVGGQTRDALSFLLVDELTVPLVGCDEHVEQFAATCGLTTRGSADLLQHRPAGGIQCPSCRLAVRNPTQPMIPVADGAVVVPACPEHQADTVDRFQIGLQTRHQLTTTLNASRPG
ncbi:hypothetical protein [Halorientalis regularis]|jgi:hypothetical protein|uniref:Uncharacterized protein n=1 Tax=Halorientalis regularis TaxID=660518 RepID=A0A1G7SXX4_9EURY|nr:hypothetical protein [Halorientalis regularis]SDG27831.1 hypothetical protein SAMN05216218_12112 [Halorientalis regularis]